MSDKFVVIMAGGRGERFWPQSRLRRPKHLLPIVGDTAMLRQTVDRLEGLVPTENVYVITNSEQADAVREVCSDLNPEQVIAEPVGRDTAPAVALATAVIGARNSAATFAMLPADHIIHDAEGLRSVLRAGFAFASEQPVLATIGIRPTSPATGYGYIQRGEVRAKVDGLPVYTVKQFVEKPDRETAQAYLASGDFFWNAGMFVWSVATLDKAFERHAPQLYKGLLSIREGLAGKKDLQPLLEQLYPSFEKISIDYALMEKADSVVTLEADFDWDDVGEWPAVVRHFPKDEYGNVVRGAVKLLDAKNNLIVGQSEKLIALLGVEDLIVVQTEDATLICPKDHAQDIKQLVGAVADSHPNLV